MSSTRRIYLKGNHRETFWRVVIAIAQREREEQGSINNPFQAIHLSDVIINTVIAFAESVKNNDQERMVQLQARAMDTPAISSPPLVLQQRNFLLSINEKQRVAFWAAMTALANRILEMRGGRNPFEFVNASALITGVFLELGGYRLSPDEQVTSSLARQRLLTVSIPAATRHDFWHMLLALANSKSVIEGDHNPFRGVDRSQLVIDMVVILATVQQTGDTQSLLALTGTPLQQPDPASARPPTLVLYINEKNRAPFWDALTALGTYALNKQGSDNPFRGISASTLIIDVILAVGEALGSNDWKRLSGLINVEEPALPLP